MAEFHLKEFADLWASFETASNRHGLIDEPVIATFNHDMIEMQARWVAKCKQLSARYYAALDADRVVIKPTVPDSSGRVQ